MTILTNFKQLLKNNYYSQDEEEDEFLRWLQLNTNYANGVMDFNKEELVTETEIDCDKDIETLKNLVSSWALIKPKKQKKWYGSIYNCTDYINGSIYINPENIKIIKQNITGSVSYFKSGEVYVYTINLDINSPVKNQIVHFEDTDYNINASRNFSIRKFTFEKLTGDFTVYLVPVINQSNVYSGGKTVITIP